MKASGGETTEFTEKYGYVDETGKLIIEQPVATQMSVELSQKIEEYMRYHDQHIDIIVAAAFGGLAVSNIVGRELGFIGSQFVHYGISSYKKGVPGERTKLTVGQKPAKHLIRGRNALLVEDLCDTSETIKIITDDLKKKEAANIWTAVLQYKPLRTTTGIVPDFYMDVTDRWVQFYWEEHEVHGSQLARPVTRPAAVWAAQHALQQSLK